MRLEAVVAKFEVSSQRSPGENKDNDDKFQSK
jgi:hypothetical protein